MTWLESSLSQVELIQHVVSNIQIDLAGDQADVRAMFHCSVRIPGVEAMVVTGGYYEEELERTEGGWKIRRLVEDNRWMEGAPGAPSPGS